MSIREYYNKEGKESPTAKGIIILLDFFIRNEVSVNPPNMYAFLFKHLFIPKKLKNFTENNRNSLNEFCRFGTDRPHPV